MNSVVRPGGAPALRAHPVSGPNNPLSRVLTSLFLDEGSALGLPDYLEKLPVEKIRRLEAAAGIPLGELRALAEEDDPELFASGLMQLGVRLEQANRLDAAAKVFACLAGAEAFAGLGDGSLRRRAQQRLNNMRGQGSFGLRAEFLLHRLARDSADPKAILAMVVAGAAFRFTRLATLTRLAASPSANVFTRGWGLRATAALAGFGAETVAFTSTAKLGAMALGEASDWSAAGFGRDWAAGALMLGGLKGLGAATSWGAARWAGGASAFERGLRLAAPTLGQFSGILLGNRLQTWTGLRPAAPLSGEFADAFASLIHFHVGGRLAGAALGSGLAAWERSIDLATARGSGESKPLVLFEQTGVFQGFGGKNVPSAGALAALLGTAAFLHGGTAEAAALIRSASHAGGGDWNGMYAGLLGGALAAVLGRGTFRRLGQKVGTTAEQLWKRWRGPERPVELFRDRIHPYRILLADFSTLLQRNGEVAIAEREGRELRLQTKLIREEATPPFGLEPGTQRMILILKEGEDARGTATAFLEAGTLHLHDLNTERLPPGAGTIVLDWFATQAALQNRGLSLREIGNPQIFRILNRAELFDAATVQVTGTYRPSSAAEAIDYVGKLSDPFLQTRQEGAQFQVTGQPNPELLPPGLRPKSLTPDQALQRLVAGNERFAEGRSLHPHQSASRREWLAARQNPIAVVMGCCDSRVPPEIVFDQGLGDLFTVRVVAHVPDPAALASVEFPARVLKTPLIVVLGHEKCAAIHAAIQGATLPGHAGGLVQGLREAMRGRGFDEHAGTEAILWNVQRVVRQLKLENPTLAPLVRAGKLRVVGAYYDLKTGRVHFVNL